MAALGQDFPLFGLKAFLVFGLNAYMPCPCLHSGSPASGVLRCGGECGRVKHSDQVTDVTSARRPCCWATARCHAATWRGDPCAARSRTPPRRARPRCMPPRTISTRNPRMPALPSRARATSRQHRACDDAHLALCFCNASAGERPNALPPAASSQTTPAHRAPVRLAEGRRAGTRAHREGGAPPPNLTPQRLTPTPTTLSATAHHCPLAPAACTNCRTLIKTLTASR